MNEFLKIIAAAILLGVALFGFSALHFFFKNDIDSHLDQVEIRTVHSERWSDPDTGEVWKYEVPSESNSAGSWVNPDLEK